MPFVTSRGSQIHYSVEGSGPLVILLHGLQSNAKSWKRWGVVDALADGYCVACVDSLGHATECLEFLSTAGNHNGAIWKYGAESGRGVRAFLDARSN